MIHISPKQMNQLADYQRLRTLRCLCEYFAHNDPALTQGRSVKLLLPVAEQAVATAEKLDMETIGAVAIIMTLLLAAEGAVETSVNLQPLFNILRDKSQPEHNRLEAVNLLLFDLDESMPPELRRHRLAVPPTPELDI